MPRHTGFLLPLFSATSTASWGIGELPDLGPLAAWIERCGGDRLMILPIGTMAPGQTSPYSACSAMAIDPIFIRVGDVPDFVRMGGEDALAAGIRQDLLQVRTAARVQYERVRAVKREVLGAAFARFVEDEWEQHSSRASALAAYIARERWWLDDYALFQALSEAYPDASWRDWPPPLRDREAAALDAIRRQHSRVILRHQYLQWLAEEQWQDARKAAEAAGVAVFGDVPFVVNLHSADVWARPEEFLLDVSVGVPADAFSETGQDWGLPAYRWDLLAERDFDWIRQRARRMAALFHGLRIDHVIGVYRTYGRPRNGAPFFFPPDEEAQVRQGETVLRIFQDAGVALIAEDLGTVPDFLRPSLDRLGVAGCKVLRWERDWKAAGHQFIDPATYPARSCALTGTHDTETLPAWWDAAPGEERSLLLRLPLFQARGFADPSARWTRAFGDVLLELAWTAASNDLFVTVQDVFGWRDRINVPATVGDHNWTWRLPWDVDRLLDIPEAVERARCCRELTDRYRVH